MSWRLVARARSDPCTPLSRHRPHAVPTAATGSQSANPGRCGGCGVARGNARSKEKCVGRCTSRRSAPRQPTTSTTPTPRSTEADRRTVPTPPTAHPPPHHVRRPSLLGVDDRARVFALGRQFCSHPRWSRCARPCSPGRRPSTSMPVARLRLTTRAMQIFTSSGRRHVRTNVASPNRRAPRTAEMTLYAFEVT
jgi:hypothetical protein